MTETDEKLGTGLNGTASPEAVSVDIYDQVYHLRGTDAEYIEQLAALNISDELLALRARYDALAGSVDRNEDSIRSRAGTLAGMLDEVLEDRRAG